MLKSNLGYLYLIRMVDTDIYKIGISKKPVGCGRMKNIQTGCHGELELVFEIKSKCYTTLEKTLHRTFMYDNLKGEWFKLNDKDVIINEIIKTNNTLETLLEKLTHI